MVAALFAVATSFESSRVSNPSSVAASFTVRAIGPAVSWECEIGIIPERAHSPTVGLMPTIPLTDAGQLIEPSVSVPIAIAHKFAATAVPDPELEPQGLRSMRYGFFV